MSFRTLLTTAFGAIAFAFAMGQARAQTELVLTSDDLLPRPLRTESGAVAGEVHALVLDPDRGSVRMVVIDLAGPRRRTVAIPWSSLSVRGDRSFWLTIPEDELLRAPSYTLRPAARIERVYTVISGPTYAPDDTAVRFDARRMASYRGVVVGTMTAPFQGAADEVVAVIDVGADEIHAHLGNQFYLDRIGFNLEPGQSVVVEGTPRVSEGRTLVVVSRISVQGRTFLLRNPDGSPRWK